MDKLTEWLTKPFLDENVDLPIEIGDTVKMGKFKNKKVVVKKIDWNEKGDLLINGRPALKFRLMPKTNIFDKEEVTEEWPKNWIPTGLGMRKRQKKVYGRLNRSIREGVNDPGIFKAVFLAGGPGSGKSYVAGGLFGIPDKVNVSAYGLKLVNQDTELENFLKKYFGTTDLDNMPDDLFRQITDPGYSAHMGVRKHAKALSKQRLKLYSQGRLGVIIDGTGHKFNEVKIERQKLIDLGYDTYMVFVNTSLEVAQMRNKLRDRVLPSELVEKYWNNVQKNMAYFQGLFGGSNFMLVDNNATLNPKQAQKKFNMLVKKGIGKFIKKPIKSRQAKKWIEKQKIVKEFIGITAGDGTIMGAPDPKTVKKQVDKQNKDLKYTDTFSLQYLKEFVNKPKMKKALKTLIDKNVFPKNYAKNISKLQSFLTQNPLVMTQLLKLLGENINESKKEFVIWGIAPGKRHEDILYTKAKSHIEAKKIVQILTKKHGVKNARIQVLDMTQDPKDIWKADKLFKEETSKIKKVVGIYAGRFQPFGPHHKKVYEWMKKQFDDAYITTSDIKKPPKHPMNFKEKVRHMKKMGIPSNKIVKEKIPYVATSVLKKFDKDTTAVVYIFGKKDAGRLAGGTKKSGGKTYYQDYKKNKNNLEGHYKHGYILTAPHFSIQAGGMEVSGTAMRQLLGSPKYADDRERRFKKFFGYFDQGVYNMMTNKFKKLFGEDITITKELINDFLVEVDVSKYLNEATFQANAPIDDGPAHYYKGFRDYKKGSTAWLDSIFKETGWVVLNHMLTDKAHDPAFDYTLNYRFMPTPSYGTVGIKGKKSERSLHNKYKERINFILSGLGFEVIKWLGLEDGEVRVQEPVLPGADAETPNTDLKELKLFSKEWWNKELLIEAGQIDIWNPEYWTDKSVKGQQKYIAKHDTSKAVEKENPSGKKERGNVVKTKPYSKEQAEEEVGEYFENDDAFEAMPNLAKDEDDLIQKIQDAPEEVLSDDDLRNMINSDAGDVLKADNPMKHAHKKAIEYDKSWDYITKSIKSGKPQEAPIAVRDKNGKMWLLAGNTRLMAQTGHGNKIPVKIIDFDGDIKVPQQESINENLKLILEIDERMTLEEGVKFNNFLKDWAKRGKQPLDKVRKSMMNKNTFSIAKLNKFSVDKVFESAKKGFKAYQKIMNYVPNKIAHKLSQTKFGQKKEKALVKLDDYLKEHPKLKRVMGIGAAAAVTYAWTKMTFIGDPEYDLDLSAAATAAAVGDVSFANLFSGEMGTKFLVLTAVGATTGLTAPYVKAFGRVGTMAAGLSFGAYRAYKARKQKKSDDEKKTKTSAPDTVKNPNPKGRKKTVGRKSAIQWVAKNKGDKAAKKYVKSLSEKLSIVEDLDLIIEGGAYGHMNHPFDDKDLTFSDLKQIIINGLGGNLDREDGVTEKLDGQNLMISWKDGKLVTARNKGQLKNFGEKAMTTKGVASKFAGRGDIKDAFVFAMKDLSKSIGALSDSQKEKVFGNGKRWMNLEVMWPKSSNVIDYDKAQIVFHGTLEYDDSGNSIGQPKGSARMLAGMIKQVNQHIQKHYKIGKPQFLSVPKSQNFDAKKKTFLSRLSKLQKEYALKDKDTLALYHQKYWEEFIFNAEKQFGVKMPNKSYKSLVKRWAFFDKSYKIPQIRKDFKKFPEFLDWILTTDKVDHQKMVKQNMRPFEVLFFAVGTEILKNIGGYLAASPDAAVQKIRKNVIGAISKIKTAKDVKKLETLKQQISKLNSIGGLDSIVPSEGIVFKYKGKVYKFTGAFAPVNQILGLLTF